MKRFVCLIAGLSLVFLASCSGYCKRDAALSKGADVAMVGGIAITSADLDKAAKNELQRVETQIYQIKKGVLDGLVEEKLVEAAAKKAGKSKEEFLAAEIDSKIAVPTEEEIKALYEARKGVINQPFEQVQEQIKGFLTQNKKGQLHGELIAKLKKDSDVKVMLEPPRITIDYGKAEVYGDDDAKVTIVEFSDYQCPFCKRVRQTVWQLVDEYKGKVKYAFLDFPLSFHKQAKKAHEAAHCAGDQGKYYEYNKKIFDNQKGLEVADLKKYAGQLKLDQKKFDECLDGGKHAETVDKNVELGMNSGVSGTPAFFINGIMLSGAQPHQAFVDIIEEELKR